VLIATLGVLAIGYVVALYARRFAGAGAVYEYLTHGAHPWLGVLTAGFFFIGVLFLGGGGIYLGLGILADGFWTEHISDSGPAWWLWALDERWEKWGDRELFRQDAKPSELFARQCWVSVEPEEALCKHVVAERRREQQRNHAGS